MAEAITESFLFGRRFFSDGLNRIQVNYFKSMTKGCVVMGSDEFKQWDTIVDANGNFKDNSVL